ncbi:hypothetical protein [Streptomyces sp. NPDC060065]
MAVGFRDDRGSQRLESGVLEPHVDEWRSSFGATEDRDDEVAARQYVTC